MTEAQLAVVALYLAIALVQRERKANSATPGPMNDADLAALSEALVEMRDTFMHWPRSPRRDVEETFLAIDASGLVVHKRDRGRTWRAHQLTWEEFVSAAIECETWARALGGLA